MTLNDQWRKIMMKVKGLKIFAAALAAAILLFSFAECETPQPRNAQDIIEELAVDYGLYGKAASSRVKELVEELRTISPDLAERWKKITELWASVNTDLELNTGGLPQTDELCIVVLGFQLNEDGTMREELIARLKVVLASAQKYPNAYIVCTGGGTAAGNRNATEAGEMAKWLIGKGIDKKRVIVEDNSLTTAQNAIFTYDILTTQYPKVSKIAIVSSNYHIATGVLLFSAEPIIRATVPGSEKLEVISNAAWNAPYGSLSPRFQAGALIELSGDTPTAYEIYYDTYDIHELPPLN